MSDRIDRAELIKALNECAMEHHKSHIPMVEHDFRELVHKAEGIEVVECGECEHWMSNGGALMVCEFSGLVVNDYDFCSYGERRKDR